MNKQKNKILVVDDDPNLRKTLSDILKIKGYGTAVAGAGAEAIAAAEHETFRLALIDLTLPDIPGLQVMARQGELAANQSNHSNRTCLSGHRD
ncbi:MAG: response regulator [Methylococcales bacterium]|nr:response regulator [Methylococcales bacterium]